MSKFVCVDGLSDLNTNFPVMIAISDFESLVKETNSPAIEPTPIWFSTFQARLLSLREAAEEDATPVCEASFEAATHFASNLSAARHPSTFLLENGNIRLLWVNDAGEQVGLQFRGAGWVQFVFFTLTEGQMEQTFGTKRISGIVRHISASGVKHVIAA